MCVGFLISLAIVLPVTTALVFLRTTFRIEIIPLVPLSSMEDKCCTLRTETLTVPLAGVAVQAESELQKGLYSQRQGVSLMTPVWTSTLSLWRVYP